MTGERSLGVLGWPAFANRAEQPYNWLLYSHLRQQGVAVEEYSVGRVLSGRFQVLHLHWPDRRVRDRNAVSAVARSVALLALLDVARARRMRVVWTVHNLEAHEGTCRPWFEPRYWRALTRRVHAFISLSESGIESVRDRFPEFRDRPGFAIPHGHLRGVYPDEVTRAEARRALELPPVAKVIAFVGQLRRYKNAPHLAETFRRLPGRDYRLLIAGKPKPPDLEDELRAASGADPRIRIDARFIPDEELQLYLRAADLVALPYRDIFNSASAVLALSFDRPVLLPEAGGMPDLQRFAGREWVRLYREELSAETLREAAEWAVRPDRPRRPELDGLGWDRIARLTREAYRSVLGRPAR